ncbi:MAG: tetratricopeptide repeat protein [Phaeodactylibacter sp.]|nr:tetratricopeptide repeat protein [Phaeodactylibacter sp.]MCB9053221.1 tetratricopeptide repeat protein [Lewinellaceae bacterium]
MGEEERNDLIDAFLDGHLAQPQVEAVEALMRTDPAFQSAMEEEKALREALGPSNVNAFLKVVKKVVEERSPERKKLARPVILRIALAAVLAGVLAAGWWALKPQSRSSEELFAQYFSPPANSKIFRDAEAGQTAAVEAPVQVAIDSLYYHGNNEEALLRLRAYGKHLSETPSSDYYFWLGILSLLNGQPDQALKAFSAIRAGYPYEKPWYIALSHLKAGRREQARSTFEAIAATDSPYQKDARAIIRSLAEGD